MEAEELSILNMRLEDLTAEVHDLCKVLRDDSTKVKIYELEKKVDKIARFLDAEGYTE